MSVDFRRSDFHVLVSLAAGGCFGASAAMNFEWHVCDGFINGEDDDDGDDGFRS